MPPINLEPINALYKVKKMGKPFTKALIQIAIKNNCNVSHQCPLQMN